MFVVYKRSSGHVVGVFSLPLWGLDVNVDVDEGVIVEPENFQDGALWVEHNTGTAHPKGDYTLTTLPLPCTITIEGVRYENVGTQPTFEFDAPGTYIIQVDAGARFLKKEFEYVQHPATLLA